MSIIIDNSLTVVSILVTIASVIISISIYVKSKRLQKDLKTFNWEKINISSIELGKKIKKVLKPDVIFTYTPRSGIIALIIRDTIDVNIPLFVGVVFHKKTPKNFDPKNFITIDTNKMDIFIPDALLEYKDKKVLIVDEYTLTGDSLNVLKKSLISKGFDEKKLKTVSLIETETAKISKKSPDFSFYTVESPDFYLPWGKAL